MPRDPYRPAWWLPGAHLKTMWGWLARRGSARLAPTATGEPGAPRLERWPTADGDLIELVRLDAPPGAPASAPHLLLLHGLEGTVRSHYVAGVFAEAHARGWAATLLLFRTCDGRVNQARRFYHSGETTDLDAVVRRLLAESAGAPLGLVGVSLGGNVLLKWLGEQGHDVPPRIAGAVAVSVPYDLARASRHIHRGFARVYERHFLRSLRRKTLAKLERYPDLVPRADVERARTIWAFDDLVTAPVHGFASAADYYARSSAIRWIHRIRVPTLLLSAADDPFLPADVLGAVQVISRGSRWLTTEFVARGGHVGFITGGNPLRPFSYAEWRACDYLEPLVNAWLGASPLSAVKGA